MSARRPPLYAVHEDGGASFTDFGGWEMPVEFDSIQTEHEAVRTEAGRFDVSHMGQIDVVGPDAIALTRRLVTNGIGELESGQARYAAITDEDGTMLDDTIVYRLPDRDGEPAIRFVPNAGHDGEMLERWQQYRDRYDLDATVTNRTDEFGMIAVQGPEARDLVADRTEESIENLGRFQAQFATISGVECWVARTGFTGEDGFELMVPAEATETVWSAIECQPCGLGARDTLRIEAGYLLSGQDFDPETQPRTPYEAGIGFAVKLDQEFVGRDALEAQYEDGVNETFVGLELIDRGVPRNGYEITTPEDEPIGVVTSGTMSPTLDKPIALGYVPVEYQDEGTKLRIVVRGEGKKARVTSPRFVDTV
jgi:aminomethyltransferase